LAGLREGDVIVKFGEHAYPTQRQIRDTVIKGPKKPPGSGEFTWRQRLYNEFSWNPERDIPIEVIRDDKRIALVLTPKIKKGVPLVGWEIRGSATDSLRIAEVLGTVHGRKAPAAECDIPKGALIEAVNDQPVSTWPALIELFRQNAGSTVQLRFKTPGGPVEVCPLDVPHDLYTKLGLTTLATIESINNQRTITVESTSRYHNISAGHSFGLYRLLKQALVESGGAATSVKVVYRESPYGSLQEAEVELNEDMIDPWLARVRYASNVLMQNELETLKASGPVDALVIGIHKTWYFVLQVYTMMERMIFSRSVGVEHLSGPVGIVKIGSDVARVGFVEFLFFLAIISANLAVINFLPLPIVDGGLMVFLIIEKIKGSPVSLKVQVATQVIGLCLIVSAFIFVTFQDILRLAG
jgi:membrane-associated protease RseP (regulator of RpoE activity)